MQPPADRVDGVLLLDKPLGLSSNNAVQRVRRLFSSAKAGHVGTLDPLASGLLPVCLGEATKFSTGMFGADKTYVAEVLLGITTATGDAEGEVTDRREVAVSMAQVVAVLPKFIGAILQTPPIYSALKLRGRPLYDYARKGEHVELRARPVNVYGIDLLGCSGERLSLRVRCGKGTYVRVLAQDIGRSLGCGGHLAALRRVSVASFAIESAVTLASLESASPDVRRNFLLPVDTLVRELDSCTLNAERSWRLMNGQACEVEPGTAMGRVRIYGPGGRFLGIGELSAAGSLIPKRMIVCESPLPGELVHPELNP